MRTQREMFQQTLFYSVKEKNRNARKFRAQKHGLEWQALSFAKLLELEIRKERYLTHRKISILARGLQERGSSD